MSNQRTAVDKVTTGDLTDQAYWGERQRHTAEMELDRPTADLLATILPYLKAYEGMKFLEIGCSPGRVLAFLRTKIEFEPFGVDFSPEASLFQKNMRTIANVDASYFQCDVRDFDPAEQYDVVASFGLLEHFSDPFTIFAHHDRLCKPNGIVVVTFPNFRHLQWLYHRLLDKRDLVKHNVRVMEPEVLRSYANQLNHKIMFLGYSGHIAFWNYGTEGPWTHAMLRKLASIAIQRLTNTVLWRLLPPSRKSYAPWIVYVGMKGKK